MNREEKRREVDQPNQSHLEEVFGKVISTYTRQDAIKDGVLINISNTSEVYDAGFKIPVCLSSHLFDKINNLEKEGQDFNGRLWDVCYMASLAYRRNKKELVEFKVKFAEDRGFTTLWLVFNSHEGFTMMYPEDY